MNIVITGCSRGIGLETVRHLVAKGNTRIIGISRNFEALKLLENDLGSDIFVPIGFNMDEIFERGESLFQKIHTKMPHVDILINNAGVLYNKPLGETSKAEIEKMFMVNSISPVFLCNLLMPLLEKSKHAHVVNIGSMGGFQGSSKYSGIAWYSSSKAALACLTECMAEEFRNKNVTFNCLALGAAQTEMLNEAFPGYSAMLTAAEMAKFIASFAIEGHKVFSGKILPVALSNP